MEYNYVLQNTPEGCLGHDLLCKVLTFRLHNPNIDSFTFLDLHVLSSFSAIGIPAPVILHPQQYNPKNFSLSPQGGLNAWSRIPEYSLGGTTLEEALYSK